MVTQSHSNNYSSGFAHQIREESNEHKNDRAKNNKILLFYLISKTNAVWKQVWVSAEDGKQFEMEDTTWKASQHPYFISMWYMCKKY